MNMEIIAQTKGIRISTRKVRLVADLIRDLSAERAVDVLSLTKKRASSTIEKTLKSAIANAKHNAKLEKENLYVKRVEVNEGPFLKRFRPSTRGRVHPYKKRSSHLRIVLEERSKNGTKS